MRADVGNLTAYQHLLGETASDVLPAGFIHALAFPVAMSVMNRDDFPLPLLGMIHLRNKWSSAGRSGSLRPWISRPGPRTSGVTAPERNWTSWRRSARAGDGVSAGRACPRTWPRASSCPASTSPRQPAAPAAFSAPDPTALWQLGVDTGRAYAAVSGDFNPIHLSVLSAKALGLRRSIAHGMYLASRALADVGAVKGDSFRWDVAFEAPVFLPARVALDIFDPFRLPGAWLRSDYVAWNPRSGRRHFSGSVAAL